MKTSGLIILGLTILAIGGIALSQQQRSGLPSGPPSTDELPTAPAFTLKNYAGEDVSVADFAGRPVVLNSWAAWCPFCKTELPDFAEVQAEFGDQVTIIAINRGESRQTTKQFTDAFEISDKLVFLLDPTDAFYQAIGGFSMPETLFVDADGRIRSHIRGPIQKDDFRRQVEDLIVFLSSVVPT